MAVRSPPLRMREVVFIFFFADDVVSIVCVASCSSMMSGDESDDEISCTSSFDAYIPSFFGYCAVWRKYLFFSHWWNNAFGDGKRLVVYWWIGDFVCCSQSWLYVLIPKWLFCFVYHSCHDLTPNYYSYSPSIVFFGQTISWTMIAGMVCVLIGVGLMTIS